MAYDNKCYLLAIHFLEDKEEFKSLSKVARRKLTEEIAQSIQDYVEDLVEYTLTEEADNG